MMVSGFKFAIKKDANCSQLSPFTQPVGMFYFDS